MSRKNRRQFVVTVDLPPEVTVYDMKEYIKEAVQTWCKSFNPEEEPLFDFDGRTVKVKPLPKT